MQLDGEWTKHHQMLNVPTIFNLPYTEDGNTTKTEQYSLIGLLCGSAHQHGHFYAVFVYRGVYWLVDDGSFPRPLPELPDYLKRQIVQVWAKRLSHQLTFCLPTSPVPSLVGLCL